MVVTRTKHSDPSVRDQLNDDTRFSRDIRAWINVITSM